MVDGVCEGFMESLKILERNNRRNRVVVLSIVLAVVVLGIGCLFVGSFHMSFGEAVDALTGGGTDAQRRIVWKIRVPRVLSAVIAGAGLAVSGLIMQAALNNSMASPLLKVFCLRATISAALTQGQTPMTQA